MKRLLLDTHVLLWWLADDEKLGLATQTIIADGRNDIFVSAANIWEISIKQSLGKLVAPEDLDSAVEDERFLKLPISLFHGQIAGAPTAASRLFRPYAYCPSTSRRIYDCHGESTNREVPC